MGCSLPGFSVHGIFQEIVLEWIAISFSRGSSQPRDWTQVSSIVDRHFNVLATREVYMQNTTCQMLGWMKHKLISIISGMKMTPPSWQKVKRNWKASDEGERGDWKRWLKLNIPKLKTMASGPITSWQIDVEIVSDFIFLGSKITADGDCSHEIKKHLLLGRKVMTNLDSIIKSRDITLSTKVHLVKAMVFSSSHIWIRELDYKASRVPKNWCFWTVMLEKTLESP